VEEWHELFFLLELHSGDINRNRTTDETPFAMQRNACFEPSGARRALRSLLASYLVCLLGVSPVLGLAHLLTADHGHSYCDEHHQIEDVPLGPLDAARSGTSRERESLARAKGLPNPGSTPHTSCPFLNYGGLHTAPLPAGGQTATVVQEQKSLAAQTSGQGDFPSCPLLLAAPKTSPPSDLA
jgi:hypothetical protein